MQKGSKMGRKAAGVTSPRQAARKRFLAKAMPYMMSLFNRAEALGLDWQNIPMERLTSEIILAEEWAKPAGYVEVWQ
jgi:hypothetical protein